MENYKENWDNEYKHNWEKGINGSYQTIHLVSHMLSNIDIRHFEKLEKSNSLIDFGCAFGQASKIFNSLFENLNVTAYDFSEVATNKIKGINTTNIEPVINDFDILYCSNVLEHIKGFDINKFEAREMSIFLVPYDQEINEAEILDNSINHINSLSLKDFPKKLGKLTRTTFRIIKSTISNMATETQILIIYEKIDDATIKDIEFEKEQLNRRFEHLTNR